MILKAIPAARDRLQSHLLVWTVMPLLCLSATLDLAITCFDLPHLGFRILVSIAVSLIFALLVWLLKAATPAAAACGGVICLLLTNSSPSWPLSGFPPLALLFLLTFLATRYRRSKKEILGLSEPRTGRRASQVIANLGVAGLIPVLDHLPLLRIHPTAAYFAVLAALAEATADTVSSEIGQAIAGAAYLVTNLRRTSPGTDGAISRTGTLAGVLAAAAVVFAGLPHPFWSMTPFLFAAIFLAAVAGLFFDSLLGATLERRGWIGNDLVNFSSTAFAAVVSYPLLLAALHHPRL